MKPWLHNPLCIPISPSPGLDVTAKHVLGPQWHYMNGRIQRLWASYYARTNGPSGVAGIYRAVIVEVIADGAAVGRMMSNASPYQETFIPICL